MKRFILVFSAFCVLILSALPLALRAQSHSQTVRGIVTDVESGAPMEAVKVSVYRDSTFLKGCLSDAQGQYRLDELPTGRLTLRAFAEGYEPVQIPNLIVNSGRETIQDLRMEEAFSTVETVEITATAEEETINDMVSVSARTFSIEEADRYAGSRGDPARMASNFAGVRGSDDSRNDIVVRGNSPLGVVYRLNGFDIPNPNHFSITGSTGGPVSMLNNKVLSNSDFMTGAFPAQYGNALAGVFDLQLRNGNNEKFEVTGQLGFLGAELMAEGPISRKNRSSFLASYRYSTLSIMDQLGIGLGVGAVPSYQDLTAKLNFPTKKGGYVSFITLMGKSDIEILNCERDTTDIYDNEIGKDVYFGSRTGVFALDWMKLINEKSYLKTAIYNNIGYTYANHDSVMFPDAPCGEQQPGIFMRMKYQQWTKGVNSVYNYKMSSRSSLRAGIIAEHVQNFAIDSSRYLSPTSYRLRADYNEGLFFGQAYLQWKYKLTTDLTLNAGLHGQYLFMNGSAALEPRAGLRWNFSEKMALSFAYGMHHQMQPLHIYFQQYPDARGGGNMLNRDLDFSRSHHLVAGWDWRLASHARVRVETYYQALSRIPVEARSSSFSMMNQGTSFILVRPDTALVNAGTATNYGVELTFEKFFSHNWFLLATGSLYSSKYRGSDGVLRHTDYDGFYGTNLTGGKEFKLGKNGNTVLGISGKGTFAGGRWYSPVDVAATELRGGDAIIIDSLAYTVQFKPYRRIDLRVSTRINGKRVSHEIALDLVNVLNIRNELGVIYNPRDKALRTVPQLGFLPILYYRFEF